MFLAAARSDSGVGFMREGIAYLMYCSRHRAIFRLALVALEYRKYECRLRRERKPASDARNFDYPVLFLSAKETVRRIGIL